MWLINHVKTFFHMEAGLGTLCDWGWFIMGSWEAGQHTPSLSRSTKDAAVGFALHGLLGRGVGVGWESLHFFSCFSFFFVCVLVLLVLLFLLIFFLFFSFSFLLLFILLLLLLLLYHLLHFFSSLFFSLLLFHLIIATILILLLIFNLLCWRDERKENKSVINRLLWGRSLKFLFL